MPQSTMPRSSSNNNTSTTTTNNNNNNTTNGSSSVSMSSAQQATAFKTRIFYALILMGGMGSLSLLHLQSFDGQLTPWGTIKDAVAHLDLDQPSVLINRIGNVVITKGESNVDTNPTRTTKTDTAADSSHRNQQQQLNQKEGTTTKLAKTNQTSSSSSSSSSSKVVPTQNATTATAATATSKNDTTATSSRLRSSTTTSAVETDNEDNKTNQDTQVNENDKKHKVNTKTVTQRDKNKKLNVLLFYADDWTMRVLGKYDENVYTPNIDNLADNGMLFSNNCVTTSICWISRATLVTGTYYSRHLQNFPHANALFESLPWKETLFPRMKREGGYFTGLMGKWHAPGPGKEMDEAFNMRRFYYGSHWIGNQHVTDMNREHALAFLKERPKNKPFFLKVSFFATHAQDGHYPSFEPMNQTRWTHYPNSKYIEPPKTATEAHWKALPSFFQGSEARTRWKRRFEPDYFQDNVKDLYSMATEVDWAVGEVVKELKEQGVYNDTLIIFTTDNGNLQGEHGLTEKWYPFEESLRVPLVIYDPRMPENLRGTINHDWTLNVDLAPTILAAAGLEPSSFMQGRDLSQLYLQPKDDNTSPAWRKDFFYEFNMGNPSNASDHPWKNWLDASFAVVTDEWKYVYWPQQDYEQLFHRSVDPYDEWDLLHKLEKHADAPYDAIQTTDEIYKTMKERYAYLKEKAQSGQRV